jgi:maltooligosyltrehalose trehalohydrolase
VLSNLGAHLVANGRGAVFRVWAPHARTLALELIAPRSTRTLEMVRGDQDVFELHVPDARAGLDYLYVLDGERRRPDPRSRFQPQGVHGPSRLCDPDAFAWSDQGFHCPALRGFVLYELHVGTFTPEGTFEAVIPKLPHLRDLGVTAVELMPVAQFPGTRNWGYDGVYPYAPQASYGGPDGLKRLIDACHRSELAVVLDVVYNHIGPEGNYLRDFGPYFTDRYQGAWGDAINYDGEGSAGPRRFAIDNALYWLREYHVDALRLDAIQGICDGSPRHLLAELSAEVQEQCMRIGRPAFLIAESDLNDVRVLAPAEDGGFEIDAQWSDDFHHALRALLVPDRRGYFADFGRLSDLEKALCEGFVYDGRYSEFRKREHGTSSARVPGSQLCVYGQNHDQVANAAQGARLAQLAGLRAQRLAASVVACAPNLPLLFMGEEFAAATPFHYFVDHSQPELIEAVRRGRRAEHDAFGGGAEWADPQDERTFAGCRLDWSCIERAPHGAMLAFYRDLYALRGRSPALHGGHKELARASSNEREAWLVLERGHPSGEAALCLFNFGDEPRRVPVPQAHAAGDYRLAFASGDVRYGGDASAPQPPAQLTAGAGQEPAAVQLPPVSAAIYLKTGA